jgi:hypothetical protein
MIEVTYCDGKGHQVLFNKEKITYDLIRGPFKDKLKPDKEQVELSKEISKLCWRLLEGPADIFWDDDVGEAMGWYEKEPGSRPKESVNFWPLWTVEDAVTWIKKQGYDIFKIYIFKETHHAEVYFKPAEGNLLWEKGSCLLNVLLTFILKKLKEGAECEKS